MNCRIRRIDKSAKEYVLCVSGVKQLVSMLEEKDKTVLSLAADVVALLAKHENVRVVVNTLGSIAKLVM